MKTRVKLSDQVIEFYGKPAPIPKKCLRDELHKLEKGAGNVKPLEGILEGLFRLRSGAYRVIFAYRQERGQRVAECIDAGPRSDVYEAFEKLIHEE